MVTAILMISNDNKTKIKQWITKIIKVLLTYVVIKTIIIEIIKILITTIVTITVISNNSNLQDIMKMM